MEEEVLTIVRQAIPGHPEISTTTPLLDEGLIDSLSIIEIVAQVEDRFGIQLPDQLFVPETFVDVASLAAAMEAVTSSDQR